MKASEGNPIYTIYMVDGSTKYDLTPVAISLDFSDQEKQLAQTMTASLMNILVKDKWLSSIIKVRQRIFVYADDGTKKDEVFRGYIWNRGYKSSLGDREIVIKCYDNLIYFQESEESEFFSAGKSSEDVISSLCSKWGVNLEYDYQSITHAKLALRGTLSDIIMGDVLDLVKDQTGEKYVILSSKDTLQVKGYGRNTTVYQFLAGKNAIMTKSESTMSGMVTKVVILGKADDEDSRDPVEATVLGATDKYGTIQKLIDRDENTTLADAKKEAEGILKNDGTPKFEYEVQAPDIPWIRKGDKVYVNAGDIYQRDLYVLGVDRDISAKGAKMTLTLCRVE